VAANELKTPGSLAEVLLLPTGTAQKALGPHVRVMETATTNAQKALGPLAVPEPDILSRWRSFG